MRAVIYARYSTDLQSDASIEDQTRICRQLCDQNGWYVTQVYSDHAVSGASLIRHGYQALLNDARLGEFNVVVAESIDRLSRDQEHIAALYKQLTFQNIALNTISEGLVSELHIGLKGTMNALFLKDLAQKTRRGMEGRIRQGRAAGGVSYGYDIVREIRADHTAETGQRTINEGEAAIVRKIFEDFANGKSPRAISIRFNQENLRGPRGKPWGPQPFTAIGGVVQVS